VSKELRYLLHGNSSKYEDVKTVLYVTSQESTVWQKVGLQVLTQQGSAWRLIDTALIQSIRVDKYPSLGINRLQPEQVVELIRELGPDSVDGNKLTVGDRNELLRYISQRPANEDLWKSLHLHETVAGTLDFIEAERVFLENPDFPLDQRLQEQVVLIKKNLEIQQNWISPWEPAHAITTILQLPRPHAYSDLILDALHRLLPKDRDQQKAALKEAQWLSRASDGKAIAPVDIIRVHTSLKLHEQTIASLNNTKYSRDVLSKSIRDAAAYKWVTELFIFWDVNQVLESILNYSNPDLQHWQRFCLVILDSLQNDTNIPESLKNRLIVATWIPLKEQSIAPKQIVLPLPNQLNQHLPTLIDLSLGNYFEERQLSRTVRNHKSFQVLRNFFSKWDENWILSLVLKQEKPHNYCAIILDALSNLLSSQHSPNQTNLHQLQTTAWLLDKQQNAVSPDHVIHYPDLEPEIEALLLVIPDPDVASSQLSRQIRDRSDCWPWLIEKLFVTHKEALKAVGASLSEAPEYQLGNFTDFPLDTCWDVFATIDVSFLPVWNFTQLLPRKSFREFLLPNLLGSINEEKIALLLQSLSSSTSQPEKATVEIFNAYLRLAVQYNIFRQSILPQIRLLNQRGDWQTPDQLTWGKKENRENIDKAYVLNSEQTQIMGSYLNSLSRSHNTVLATQAVSVETNNYSVLNTYFSTWEQYCPPSFIGAFITLLMGNDPDVKNLAQLYLGLRDPEAMRQRLLEERDPSSRNLELHEFRIHVGQVDNRTTTVRSVLGSTFNAALARSSQPPHLFVSELESETLDLELLAFHPDRFSELDLSTLLKQSTKALLRGVYQVGTSSIDNFWGHLRQSDQLDIQVAKNFLLEGAPYIMRMLGAHDRIPAIKILLTRWDNLRHQRAELKQQQRSVERLDDQIEQLFVELSNLVEGESAESEQIRDDLLESVRAKIDLHGYRPQSIPFELFQNADDAVVEWMQMSPAQKLDEDRTQFLVVAATNQLLFIHAGRPINCFQHSDSPGKQYREAGFDRDLEKMLTFNISDKGEHVTGKFGLGFKSVYLVCKEPRVISKNLGFVVEGGLIPSRLAPQVTTDLRRTVQNHLHLTDATAVELDLEEDYSVEDVMQPFQEFASILLVFSRAIKQCKLISASSQPISLVWHPISIPGVPAVEVGKRPISSSIYADKSLLLCIRTAEATLLLGMAEQDGRLTKTLPDDIPTFWVTAPTREVLFLGFALNANFDITTGRESLVKSSTRNRDLANRIGEALGGILCALARVSEQNWQTLAETFGFTTISEYEFWKFLWQELAIRWQQKDPSEGQEIISCMLGGTRGMGHLITHCRALPSGLYGAYRQLLSITEVCYQVMGKLSESAVFLQTANWGHFQQTYQGKLISQSQWKQAKALLGTSFDSQRHPVNELRLLDVLQTEIGATSPRVDSTKANQVGSLITRDFLNSLETSPERNQLQDFLQDAEFMSQAETYLPCQQLLCDRSSPSEEALLAAFAPDRCILHLDYQDTGLAFFYASRLRRESIPINELTEWALQADTPEKQEAVKNYLLSGEMREPLAVKLYETGEGFWITSDADISGVLHLMVQIAIKRGEPVTHPPIPPGTDEELGYEFSDYDDLNFEFRTPCTQNDFSLSRSPDELDAFAQTLIEGLNYERSIWKGYIYHFTHVENAASIIQSEQLRARNYCQTFRDSAGTTLIHNTGNDVKDFARFYYRPKTPTQWHNEGLGKRRGDIYALCPVPIFFRFDLRRVLATQGRRCGSSNGNLAASGSHYGNSTAFLEQCFDFDNVYSSLLQVGKHTFLRASQQEFIVHQQLCLDQLSLEDITIICRTAQDKQTLLHFIGRNSKYSSRVFCEREVASTGSFFYHENPTIVVRNDSQPIEIQIDNYDNAVGDIKGEIVLRFTQEPPLDYEVGSQFNSISKVSFGNSIYVNASRNVQLQCRQNTLMSVYFQENGRDWLIYTNEPSNH
jgi:hypothetical protein